MIAKPYVATTFRIAFLVFSCVRSCGIPGKSRFSAAEAGCIGEI